MSLLTILSHIKTVSGCDREIDAHFYSAASLKYHAPDIWHDSTTSPSECQARSRCIIFNNFGYVAAWDRTSGYSTDWATKACYVSDIQCINHLCPDVLFVNWIPFGASLMKKCEKNMIIYKYLTPMIAGILILEVIVF